MRINYEIAYECCAQVAKENELYYPLDVFILVKSYGLKVISYSDAAKRKNCKVDDFIEISIYGFMHRDKNSPNAIIYYNDQHPLGTIRFTLLHELAHYLMDHREDNEKNDKLANCFARNLIAPVSICKALSLSNIYDISNYFNITLSAAQTRINLLNDDVRYLYRLDVHPIIHCRPLATVY